MEPIELEGLDRVEGAVRVPGDKSIGHRSLLFGAIGSGTTVVRGLPTGEDVRTTLAAVRALGIEVHQQGKVTRVAGRGWAGLDRAPGDAAEIALDCGNSGTSVRLLLGLLAGRSGRYRLSGDASLSRRPMARVVRPLRALGAVIEGEDHLPLRVVGQPLRGAEIATAVASAQVKSAAILAALQAEGDSVVSEPAPTRDHTERMLGAMGAPLERVGELGWRIGGGAAALAPLELEVPGDPSSAAFLVALAAIRPGSALRIERVGLNPRRIGFLRLLEAMGADLRWEIEGEQPDPWGAVEVRGSALRGIEVGGADVVDAIDELPVLAVAAATADGPTTVRGASELRVKESDRIASTAALLRAFGAGCDELPDGLVVHGSARLRGAAFDAGMDHRIAMAAAVAACAASGRSRLGGHEWVAVSYPSFFEHLREIGRG
jgi:3-phosphoshikimate 1-carboxyvinyltransferase